MLSHSLTDVLHIVLLGVGNSFTELFGFCRYRPYETLPYDVVLTVYTLLHEYDLDGTNPATGGR